MTDKYTKRDAAPQEVEAALTEHGLSYNSRNPNATLTEQQWHDKLAEAESEGCKNEVCQCGTVFLAFHHFTTCRDERCPFSDGVTLLDRMCQEADTDDA